MAIRKTRAFVLKKSDFRETSLIVRFFSADFGKMTCLFKGIRNEPEKFASSLEPFSLNEVIFYENNKNELNLASQCDCVDNFDSLRSDLNKVYAVTSMLGLIDALMQPQEASAETFSLFHDCLKSLSQNHDFGKILFIFKIKMLTLSGFQPRIDSCVVCANPIDYNQKAFFSSKSGGLLCQKCVKTDRSSRLIFRGTAASLSFIQKNGLENNLRLGLNVTIKKELSSFLDTFLDYHLEKKLKIFSEELLTNESANIK